MPSLIAEVNSNPEKEAKARQEESRVEAERRATMPVVDTTGDRGGEVVYANANSKAILMPDLRGRSVRDVARTCAQLGLQMEARGEGRVFRQTPAAGNEVSSGQVVYIDFGRAQ